MAQNSELIDDVIGAKFNKDILTARENVRGLVTEVVDAADKIKSIEFQLKGASTIKEATVGTNALVDAQGRLINATRDIATEFTRSLNTIERFNGTAGKVIATEQGLIKIDQDRIRVTRELLAVDEQAAKTKLAQMRLEKLERDKAAVEQKAALVERQAQEKAYSDWWIAELAKRDAAQPSAAIVAGRAQESSAINPAVVTSGTVVTDAETAALKEQQAAMAELNATQNTRAQLIAETTAAQAAENELDDTTIATISLYRQYVKELTVERNELNLLTQVGTTRQAELNAEIDMYNKLIKENVDSYQKQKINIGNYPTLSAELKDVRLQMERLVTAGEKDSVAFQELAARAQQLTGQLAEVRTATMETASTAEVLQGKLEKAFSLEAIGARFITSITRMLTHMVVFTIIFEAAAKLVEYFQQKMKDSEDGITSYDKELERSTAAMDKWNQRKQKQIDLLEKENNERNKQPDIFGGEGDAAIHDLERQLTILKAQQETGKNALKDKEASKKLDQDIFDLEQKITKEKIAQTDNAKFNNSAALRTAYARRESGAITEGILEEGRKLDEKKKDLETQLKANELRFGRQQGDKYDPYRAPKETAKQEYQGQKELNDAVANLRNQQIQQDVAANQQIMENDKQTLDNRLLAYQNYVSDKIAQAETERNKEVANANAELREVNKLLNDGKARSAGEVSSLLSQRAAANTKILAANQKLQADVENVARDGAKQLKAIYDSDIQNRIHGLNGVVAAVQTQKDNELIAARAQLEAGNITYQEYKGKEAAINEEYGFKEVAARRKYLQQQIDDAAANGEDITKLQEQLNKTLEDGYKADAKAFDEVQKQKADAVKALHEQEKDLAKEAGSFVQSIIKDGADKQVAALDAQIAAIKEKQDADTSAMEATAAYQALTDAQKAAAKKAIDDKALDDTKHLQAQQDKIKRQSADLQKAVAVAQIIADTIQTEVSLEGKAAEASANAALLASTPITAAYAPAALAAAGAITAEIPLVAGIAALRIGTILASKAYKEGTQGQFSALGLALTDEAGPEMYIGQSGKAYMGTDAGPTLRYFNEPTRVIPNDEVMAMARMYTAIPRMPGGNADAIDAKGIRADLKTLTKAIENKPVAVQNITGMGMQNAWKQAGGMTVWVNNFSA